LVVANGPGSPFEQVLAWLAKREDFFTAASIALDMLQDGESLVNLWRNADSIEGAIGDAKLEGLLDGIIPIDPLATPHPPSPHDTTTTAHLADMTVGCLINGGSTMSGTLRKFLEKNESYDPARASLMLAATAVSAVSGDPLGMRTVPMGASGDSMKANVSHGNLLWPVECLLQIGTVRNYLQTVISLLNVTLPDELRHRTRRGQLALQKEFEQATKTLLDIEVTTKLVGLIAASDSSAIDMLFDCEDDESRLRYWQSLDHGTQLTLSLIEIDNAFPLLRHPDVRAWVREEINLGVKQSTVCAQDGGGSASPTLPTLWLQKLCVACLRNGGCDLTDFEIEDDDAAFRAPSSVGEFDSARSTSTAKMLFPSYGRENSSFDFEHDDGLRKHRLEIVETRNALMPKHHSRANESGLHAYSLDFDLIVPCMLLLEARDAPWMPPILETTEKLPLGGFQSHPFRKKKFASTGSILDAACYLAGRRESFDSNTILTATKMNDQTDEKPNLFASFDFKTAMRQCFMLRNVSAGASLIGGKNGFILHVCDVLIQELGFSMAAAESFILDDELNVGMAEECTKELSSFEITPAHRKLLWLLDEHVLSIKTFGEFEAIHMRGCVDPVFASRSIFRAWLCICFGDKRTASTWLCSWLERRLGICTTTTMATDPKADGGSTELNGNKYSPGHRLACAALARSLIWPTGRADPTSSLPLHSGDLHHDPGVPLASQLEMDNKLLIQICQSCVGLVESVPVEALEGIV
jgi:hypothetical protein